MSDFDESAFKQYEALGSKVRLVIVHPHYAQAHRLLRLMTDAHYLALQGRGLDRSQIQAQFQTMLKIHGDMLGPKDWVIIDEADRAAPDGLFVFIRDELLPQLQRGRVILIGRSLPMPVLQDPKLSKLTQIVPVDPERMLIDYAQARSAADHVVEVRALGQGRVQIDGRAVESWDGNLPRTLFFYLVDRGMVTRSDIFADFWPDLSVLEATNVFHVTKRKISEVLGTELTEYHSGFYHLSARIVLHYDVHVFNRLLQECSIAEPKHAIAMLRQAAALYRGPYVRSLTASWAARRREELAHSYGDLLAMLARLEEQQGNLLSAFSHYVRASRLTPPRDDVMERILTIAPAIGAQADALIVYERFKKALRRSLGKAPSAHLKELAAASAKTRKR